MKRQWSPDEDVTLRARFPHEKTATVALALRRSVSSVYQRAYGIGLRKSSAFLASPASGRTNGRQGTGSRFTAGHVPFNKGLRRPGWAPGRMAETQFKKGSMSGAAQHNYVPVGSERVSKDGYIERKVTDDHPVPARRWVAVHRIVWEAVHGPVPKGHAIGFKNRDKTDIRIENLECIGHVELMARNSYHNLPAPLLQLIQLRGALNRKINRKTNHEEQNARST